MTYNITNNLYIIGRKALSCLPIERMKQTAHKAARIFFSLNLVLGLGYLLAAKISKDFPSQAACMLHYCGNETAPELLTTCETRCAYWDETAAYFAENTTSDFILSTVSSGAVISTLSLRQIKKIWLRAAIGGTLALGASLATQII